MRWLSIEMDYSVTPLIWMEKEPINIVVDSFGANLKFNQLVTVAKLFLVALYNALLSQISICAGRKGLVYACQPTTTDNNMFCTQSEKKRFKTLFTMLQLLKEKFYYWIWVPGVRHGEKKRKIF